jgi:membrane-bound ClpP family serine protease
MTIFAITLLIVLGLVLLLIEFAIIPGITIAGIGGFILLSASIYMAFVQYGNVAGFLTLAIVLIVSPILIVYFFKSKSGKKMILNSKIHGTVDTINKEKIKAGDIGKTIGRLAPMGKIKVNGETFEAQSMGSFIDHNTEIIISKIHSNKIIVEPFNKE